MYSSSISVSYSDFSIEGILKITMISPCKC
jgi:hypothetical protein